jgi:hypothetical protein
MYQDEPDCDNSGLCTALEKSGTDGEISFCIYCGSEMICRSGLWYKWDYYLYKNSKPQNSVNSVNSTQK